RRPDAARLARPDFGQRTRSAGWRRRKRRPRRQQPGCVDCLVPQGVRLGRASRRNAERLRQTRLLPRRARNSGSSFERRLALGAAWEIWRDPGRLPARDARLRGGNQEVQTLRHQNLVRPEGGMARRWEAEGRAARSDWAVVPATAVVDYSISWNLRHNEARGSP